MRCWSGLDADPRRDRRSWWQRRDGTLADRYIAVAGVDLYGGAAVADCSGQYVDVCCFQRRQSKIIFDITVFRLCLENKSGVFRHSQVDGTVLIGDCDLI